MLTLRVCSVSSSFACGSNKKRCVVIRIEQVDLDRGAPFSFANIRVHVGLPFERAHVHPNFIGAFPVQFGGVLDAYPARRGVDLEGARFVVEHILELGIFALVTVGGKHLKDSETGRQILDDRYVVHVVLELSGADEILKSFQRRGVRKRLGHRGFLVRSARFTDVVFGAELN